MISNLTALPSYLSSGFESSLTELSWQPLGGSVSVVTMRAAQMKAGILTITNGNLHPCAGPMKPASS